MDVVTFNIDKHAISYHVNWLGIETVKVNDIQVSKKLSLPKRKHKFSLDVFGKNEAFHITSKQLFSSGYITVQLFHNDVLIDEKILEFNFPVIKDDSKNTENSTFMIGMIFIIFSLVFDWSKLFLFIGLIFVFDSVSRSKAKTNNSEDNNLKSND